MRYTCGLFGANGIWMILFILALTAIIFIPDIKQKKESALDVLHRSFAAGALSVEDYEERKAILEKDKIKKK